MSEPTLILAVVFAAIAALLILALFVYMRQLADDSLPMAQRRNRKPHDSSACPRCRFIADITADHVEDLLR